MLTKFKVYLQNHGYTNYHFDGPFSLIQTRQELLATVYKKVKKGILFFTTYSRWYRGMFKVFAKYHSSQYVRFIKYLTERIYSLCKTKKSMAASWP